MIKRNILTMTVLMCTLAGLLLIAAAIPAQATSPILQSATASVWDDPIATAWCFTLGESWTVYSPINWLWGNLWQRILLKIVLVPGDHNPVKASPGGLCGGDDGFINYHRD